MGQKFGDGRNKREVCVEYTLDEYKAKNRLNSFGKVERHKMALEVRKKAIVV